MTFHNDFARRRVLTQEEGATRNGLLHCAQLCYYIHNTTNCTIARDLKTREVKGQQFYFL